MGNTKYYNLPYLDPRQPPRGDMDRRRMRTIDRALQWLFSLFGNGVLDDDPLNPSWRIQTIPGDTSGRRVQITPGKGHVSWMSARTNVFTVVDVVATVYPTTFWLYVVADDTTPDKGTVKFVAYTQQVNRPETHVGLGGVVARLSGDTVVLTPYNTAEYGRVNISVFATLANFVNRHRHIGGANNPSPIDLARHVRGKLAGSNIEDLSASDVKRGELDPNRLSPIPHGKLLDVGTMSHREIETTLGQLVYEESSRLSDLAVANLLVFGMAERRAGNPVDLHALNQILYVPGATPDSFVSYYEDFEDYGLEEVEGPYVPEYIPLAEIDKLGKRIVGTTATGLANDNIVYSTVLDWQTEIDDATHPDRVSAEPVSENVVAVEASGGAITLEKPLNYRSVAVSDVSNWLTSHDFTDLLGKKPDTPPPTQFWDDYEVDRYIFLEFGSSQNWLSVDKLTAGFSIGSTSEIGALEMFLILDSPVSTASTILTESGGRKDLGVSQYVQVRGAAEPAEEGVAVEVPISAFVPSGQGDKLAKVKGVGFRYGTARGWTTPEAKFWLTPPEVGKASDTRVDLHRVFVNDLTSTIFVWNAAKYAPSGRLVVRYRSGLPVTQYGALSWSTTFPGNVRLSTRVANTEEDLASAEIYLVDPLSPTVNPLASSGAYIDLIIELAASGDNLQAPILDELRLDMLVPSASEVKTWDRKVPANPLDVAGWSKYRRFDNLATTPDVPNDPSSIVLDDASSVGSYTYIRGNRILSDDPADTDPETTLQNGALLYQTPYQVWNGESRIGFERPSDAFSLRNGGWVVADTINDRVVQVDSEGRMIRAIQGNIRLPRQTRPFAVLSAAYNPRIASLWVAFSQNVGVKDRGKISLSSGSDGVSFAANGINVVPHQPDASGKSATLLVTFPAAVASQIASWTNPIQLLLVEGCVENQGPASGGGGGGGIGGPGDGGLGGGGNQGGGNGGGGLSGLSDGSCGFPSWYQGYFYSLGAGEFEGDGDCAYSAADSGLPEPPPPTDGGQFKAGESRLQGPRGQIGTVLLDVVAGEILFDRLFGPISIQVNRIGDWVVGATGDDAVISYGPNSQRQYVVSRNVVRFREGFLGSAWELPNMNLLVAVPAGAGTSDKGAVQVYNRRAGNVLVTNAVFFGDAVRALPSNDGLGYWAAIDDRKGGGKTSRLVRVNASGRVDWMWGVGTISRPKGLAILQNGTLAVSE
jgi:hypothetical protein